MIVGWDSMCGAEEDWIIAMGIDTLAHNRRQPFYEVSVDEAHWERVAKQCYVAQQNIVPMDAATTPVRNSKLADSFEEEESPEIDLGESADVQRRPGEGEGLCDLYPDDVGAEAAEAASEPEQDALARWGGFEGLRQKGLAAGRQCLSLGDERHSVTLCTMGALHLVADPPEAAEAVECLEASLRSNPWGGDAAPLLYRARRFAADPEADVNVGREE